MPLNRKQIDAVRQATGHLTLELRHIRGWDEHLIEDYLAQLNEPAQRMDEHHEAQYDRVRRRLCNVLGIQPGPGFEGLC